jgi:hypothetical protein
MYSGLNISPAMFSFFSRGLPELQNSHPELKIFHFPLQFFRYSSNAPWLLETSAPTVGRDAIADSCHPDDGGATFPALPDFLSSSGSATGLTQPREDTRGAT